MLSFNATSNYRVQNEFELLIFIYENPLSYTHYHRGFKLVKEVVYKVEGSEHDAGYAYTSYFMIREPFGK